VERKGSWATVWGKYMFLRGQVSICIFNFREKAKGSYICMHAHVHMFMEESRILYG
jgi:hypothetical protein